MIGQVPFGEGTCLNLQSLRASAPTLPFYRVFFVSYYRPLKKAHLLRCAQSPRSNVLPKYASARRFLARLAPGTFLTGLETGFFKTLLERHLERGCLEIRITAHLFPANSLESTHNS